MNVAIIGAGFAGLSAARFLDEHLPLNINIDVFEVGAPYSKRFCPARGKGGRICTACNTCDVLSGGGGAGTIHGGKLCNYPAGSKLLNNINEIGIIDDLNMYLSKDEKLKYYNPSYRLNTLDYISSKWYLKKYFSEIRLASDMSSLVQGLLNSISKRVRFHYYNRMVQTHRLSDSIELEFSSSKNNNSYGVFDKVILATGRSGASNIRKHIKDLGLHYSEQEYDLGLRLEFPIASSSKPFGVNDPKIKSLDSDPLLRTFCMCWGGMLTSLPLFDGIQIVDGCFGALLTKYGNVALMARVMPKNGNSNYQEASEYARKFEAYHGIAGQSWNQFETKSSNIASILGSSTISLQPKHVWELFDDEWHGAIVELAYQFAKEGNIDLNTANVCGPAVDRHWPLVRTDASGCADDGTVYVAGDARGIARGYLQAVWGGVLVAQSILKSLKISTSHSLTGT